MENTHNNEFSSLYSSSCITQEDESFFQYFLPIFNEFILNPGSKPSEELLDRNKLMRFKRISASKLTLKLVKERII